MGKIKTPDWVLKGKEKPKTKSKNGRIFKIRICPKCKSQDVGVVIGEEKRGEWECRKCKWKGKEIEETEMDEEEFMKTYGEEE